MSSEKNNWYLFDKMDEVDSPALLIYIDRVKENIITLKSMVNDVDRLRPHVKTHKSADITQLLIQSGIQKFKCATIAEAEMLGICHAKDVLLAYQPIGPKLERFIELIKKYPETKFSCLTDNDIAAKQMAKSFSSHDLSVPVYIDINIGQDRTGIAPGIAAIQLYMDCSKMKGIVPVGLHAYDGHIYDSDLAIRTFRCDEAFESVEAMKNELIKNGFKEPVIIAGGSPTFPIHSKRENVECSPGTFIYWDKGYMDKCAEQDFLPAALLIARVISLPGETKICLDLGHKSVAAENDISKRVYFINAPELRFISQSEEHLIADAGEKHPYAMGDILFGIPYHVCPTVALYETAYTVDNGKLTGEWNVTARGRKINL